MYYILFGGKYSRENLDLCHKLKSHWVTFDNNTDNFLMALSLMNRNNPSAYNLVLFDPYIMKRPERFQYLGKILKLNHGQRKIAVIKDTKLEESVTLYRNKYKFLELSRESNLVVAINQIISAN